MTIMHQSIVLLPEDAFTEIIGKVYAEMEAQDIPCALISSNANIFYLTGRVYSGYVMLIPGRQPIFLVKRPTQLQGPNTIAIHKPEVIISELSKIGVTLPSRIGLELGNLAYNNVMRLEGAFEGRTICDVSALMSKVRSTKTAYEIERIRISGIKHQSVYHQIPTLYRPGMTDLELQVEIEKLSRLEGCLGQFRIAGSEMELFMGNVLAGDNAGAPSPFDFAMGGAGIDPSLPIGANGTIIKPGMAVMVDMNGNFNGYMTDMTRTYGVGHIGDTAMKAHQLSIDICHTLSDMARPGTPAKSLYDKAYDMAKEAGYEKYFMGYHQHAGFVGHGIGIEVNELPVLAPRSKSILSVGNVIAIEPKFVIPEVGAVGIENTYVIKTDTTECLTAAPEQLIKFD